MSTAPQRQLNPPAYEDSDIPNWEDFCDAHPSEAIDIDADYIDYLSDDIEGQLVSCGLDSDGVKQYRDGVEWCVDGHESETLEEFFAKLSKDQRFTASVSKIMRQWRSYRAEAVERWVLSR